MPTASTGGYATVARVRIPLMATVAAEHPGAMESTLSSGNRQKSFRRIYKRVMGPYSEMTVKHFRSSSVNRAVDEGPPRTQAGWTLM
jgi:hypothetical protein